MIENKEEKSKPLLFPCKQKIIDSVVLIKMLLIGSLYGVKSERRLEEKEFLTLFAAGFRE